MAGNHLELYLQQPGEYLALPQLQYLILRKVLGGVPSAGSYLDVASSDTMLVVMK